MRLPTLCKQPKGWATHGLFIGASSLVQDLACETLLQNLHHCRGRSLLGLADEQVNVVGHHHIADHDKEIALPRLFQNLQERARRGSLNQGWRW